MSARGQCHTNGFTLPRLSNATSLPNQLPNLGSERYRCCCRVSLPVFLNEVEDLELFEKSRFLTALRMTMIAASPGRIFRWGRKPTAPALPWTCPEIAVGNNDSGCRNPDRFLPARLAFPGLRQPKFSYKVEFRGRRPCSEEARR